VPVEDARNLADVRLGGESAPSIEETAVMTKSIVIRGGVNAVLLIEKI
jgi:hypothetical protein